MEGAIGASAPGVSAGASMTEVSVTAVSSTDASAIGVSTTGTAVAPTLGLLELGVWASAFMCDSRRDSLGATWGHLGKGAPAKCGHSWRQPW